MTIRTNLQHHNEIVVEESFSPSNTPNAQRVNAGLNLSSYQLEHKGFQV